jgi:cell division protein FtsW
MASLVPSRLRARGPRRHAAPQPLEHRILLTATFCLLAGGAVMVYSASSARTMLEAGGDGTGYLMKYLVYGGLGLICMHVLSRRGLQLIRDGTPLLLLGAFLLLLLVLVPGLGVNINGAQRWLGVGPLQFQPSEVMKLALVLHVAAVIAARPRMTRHLRGVMGPVLLVGAGAIGLIFLQPDLGTALVIAFTLAAMLAVAGVPGRQLALVAGVGVVIVSVFAVLEPYRRARLTSFLNPWADAGGAGFQSVQGQIAIGSGGLLGQRAGPVRPEDLLPPEAHTDFILAVIGEELGVVGIVLPARPVRHDRLRRAAHGEGGQGRLRQAPRDRTDLADPVPSPAERLHRPRPRPAHGRAAALHLLGLDIADRAALLDGDPAEHRGRGIGAPARRAGPAAQERG